MSTNATRAPCPASWRDELRTEARGASADERRPATQAGVRREQLVASVEPTLMPTRWVSPARVPRAGVARSSSAHSSSGMATAASSSVWLDPLRRRHPDDGRVDHSGSQRELQRRGGERDVVAPARRLHRLGRLPDPIVPGAVGVLLLHARALRQHAAAVGGRVEHAETTVGGGSEERLGRAVEQGVPVVAEHDLERTGVEVRWRKLDRAAGHPQVLDQPLLPKVDQRLHRTARSHALLEGDPLRVVQVQQRDPVDARGAPSTPRARPVPGRRRSRRCAGPGRPWWPARRRRAARRPGGSPRRSGAPRCRPRRSRWRCRGS